MTALHSKCAKCSDTPCGCQGRGVMNDQPPSIQERLAANLAQVCFHIAEAAQRVGRSPAEITLVAVSKTVPLDLVQIAYNLGVTDFGENRVQDALPKIAEFHPQGKI